MAKEDATKPEAKVEPAKTEQAKPDVKTPVKSSAKVVTGVEPVSPVADPILDADSLPADVLRRVQDWPVRDWRYDDPYREEKEAMLQCVAGTRPTRPTGMSSLLRRMMACGTGRQSLERFFDMLPRDRYGELTGEDIPIDEALDAMKQVIEWDEAHVNDDVQGIVVPRLDRYTYEKAKMIAKKGYWYPPTVARIKLTKALADEVFDPSQEDEEEEVDVAKKKSRKSVA